MTTPSRASLSLAGPWRFSPDPHADGEALGFWRPAWDVRLWREVGVPCSFETAGPGLDFYEGLCWYRRGFRLDPAWHGRRVVLRFEGVNNRARVWLNGTRLGESPDPFLPFEFEIQAAARWDGENTLVLAVDNAHHEGDVPGMHVGWRGDGGILRDVSLRATDARHIEQFHVTATPVACGPAQRGELTFRLRVRNAQPAAARVALRVTVRDAEGRLRAELQSAPAVLAASAATDIVLTGALEEARLWSPAAPVLYRACAQLLADDGVADEAETAFGVRRIEATPQGLLLNGEPVFLTGFNRHEDSPRTGLAADRETTRRDLAAMKEAGANFVRLCHYPHDPAELELCDELGLLAMAEIPLYFWNDVEEGRRTQAQRGCTAARQLECMIARDFNHPSIIFWSVSNETHEDEAPVAETNRELIRQARALDPTRLCVHVSNHWLSGGDFEEDDVLCVNHYPSIDWRARGHAPGGSLAPSAAKWRAGLEALHGRHPQKPVLVSEFGYCSFAGTHGHAFGEDEHARVLEAEFAAFDAPYVCGAAIWCWADHPWPAGRFLGGLGVSPFGVVSRDRRRLKPFWAARALFRARQAITEAAPSARSTSVTMIRPHLDGIPDAPFPAGYGVRAMTTDDIGLWTDIERDAEPYVRITDATFRSEFGDDLAALGRRCYILTDPRGLGVGTVSAWYARDFGGEDCGRIHWLAVRPSCQGKGLGKAALAYALRQLAQWHERCYLVTSVERLVAVRLYLDFGFEPDLRPAPARDLWSELAARLKHPALERALGGAGPVAGRGV